MLKKGITDLKKWDKPIGKAVELPPKIANIPIKSKRKSPSMKILLQIQSFLKQA